TDPTAPRARTTGDEQNRGTVRNRGRDDEAAMTNEELTARWQGALMDTYGTPRVPIVRGEGCRLWDADGRSYLDFVGGIAVTSLGTGHPAVVRAVSEQI